MKLGMEDLILVVALGLLLVPNLPSMTSTGGVSLQDVEVPDSIMSQMEGVRKAAKDLKPEDRIRLAGLYYALGNLADNGHLTTTEHVRTVNLEAGTVLTSDSKIAAESLMKELEKVNEAILGTDQGKEVQALEGDLKDKARDLFWAQAMAVGGG